MRQTFVLARRFPVTAPHIAIGYRRNHKRRSISMNIQSSHVIAGFLCTICTFPAASVQAAYPERPIRMLTTGIGGNGDVTARILANGLTPRLGQQVIVDNRPSGFMSSEIASKAQPDGYTLLVLGSTLWMTHLVQRVSFDAIKDFAPVTLVTRTPNVLVVSPSVPVNSVQELVSHAKLKPGAINYGVTGPGSSIGLAALLFQHMTGINIVRVAYKSSSILMVELMSGQIQMSFPTGAAAAPLVKAGKIKALAVTTLKPSPSFPGLPAVADSVPDYESESPIGILAPAGTPAAVLKHLHAETLKVLQEPQVKERLFRTGAEAVGNTPAEFAAKIKADVARMTKVIRAAGITVQ